MTEFELAQQQEELETLKRTQPRWALATPEPFAHSAQQDVAPPTWDKIKFPDLFSDVNSVSGNQNTFQAIVALNGIPFYALVNGVIQTQVPL